MTNTQPPAPVGGTDALSSASRLYDFIRDHTSGGCRILTELHTGKICLCPLCDVDRLMRVAASPLTSAQKARD